MSPYGEENMFAGDEPTVRMSAVSAGIARSEAPDPDQPGQPSGDTGPQSQPTEAVTAHRRDRRRALIAGAIAAVALAAGLGTAGYAYAGEVPRGTTVLGIDIGARSRADAAKALSSELVRRKEALDAAVTVRVGDQYAKIKPAEVGLAVDVNATVAAAVATDPNPVSLLFGSRTVDPVVRVDAARLDALLLPVAKKEGRAMTMPAITFAGTTPKAVYPKPGIGLDAERSAHALCDSWLSGKPVVVPLVEVYPATTAAEVDRLVAELAKPAVAAPVTVTTERGTFAVTPRTIAKSLVLTADRTGRIKPRIDEKKLRRSLAAQLAKVEVAPKNATMSIVSGRPRIARGTDGRVVDTAALGRDLLAVLPKVDGRTVDGVHKPARPETTAEELAGLGIKERVSTFTTHFTGGLSSPRSKNIVQISKEVDGAVVKPGAVFSLNGHTGERSYEQGYHDAPVIVDGKLVPGAGGGNSQFTTTLFNASYYAGMEDIHHRPHSYYFSRYPPVIESTVFYPDLDFKFRNNTRYGVLIDTSYTSDSITVSIWSTKVYDSVTTKWSARRNITQPQTIYLKPGPSCIPSNGSEGFTQDAWRIFRKDGKEIRRERFTWTYKAEPRYICDEPA